MFTSLGIYFFGSLGLILLIFAVSTRDDFLQGPLLLVGVVGPHALLLTHLFWVSRRKGISFADDFRFRFQWSDARLGFGLFFGALIAAGMVAVLITQIVGDAPTASAVELAQELGDGGLTIWLWLFAILGAAFVPVVEELVYRGLFWSALEKRGMRPWTILVVTSAVFAIIHLEPIRTAVLFVVGMAIGIGRLVTGRVGASIATHVFINTMAMTATLVQLA
ncbi:MAG: membrane protease YdiL (CAAX protease family) [Paracrocinitomix sp.]|jgi:membrane protease YdiL (CAAX protease family)